MKSKKGISYAKYGYIFCIPFVVTFLIFSFYPTIYTAVLGFTDSKGLGNINFKILDQPFINFISLLNNPTFIQSLKNSFLIWIINFIPQILLALLLTAWFTNRRTKVKGQGFFKVVFYMPNIITAASIALLFYAMFGYPTGTVNGLLMKLGLVEQPFYFAASKTASRLIVAFIQFWMWFGYTMLIMISGVLGISPEIYEAAEIDGANGFQTFFQITLPNIRTILLYTLVTSLIGGLNMYDVPKLFNLGGPDNATLTTSVFIYNQAFSGSYMYARAAAASMIMFVIIAICSGIMFFLMRDRDEVSRKKALKKLDKNLKLSQKVPGGERAW